MFQYISVNRRRVFAFKASGQITRRYYWLFLPRLRRLILRWRKLVLLAEFQDFKGWKPRAARGDLSSCLEPNRDRRRIAVPDERSWRRRTIALSDLFTSADCDAPAIHL